MTALTYSTGFGTPTNIQVDDTAMEAMLANPLGFAYGTTVAKKLHFGTLDKVYLKRLRLKFEETGHGVLHDVFENISGHMGVTPTAHDVMMFLRLQSNAIYDELYVNHATSKSAEIPDHRLYVIVKGLNVSGVGLDATSWGVLPVYARTEDNPYGSAISTFRGLYSAAWRAQAIGRILGHLSCSFITDIKSYMKTLTDKYTWWSADFAISLVIDEMSRRSDEVKESFFLDKGHVLEGSYIDSRTFRADDESFPFMVVSDEFVSCNGVERTVEAYNGSEMTVVDIPDNAVMDLVC